MIVTYASFRLLCDLLYRVYRYTNVLISILVVVITRHDPDFLLKYLDTPAVACYEKNSEIIPP